jgi:ferredoxin
MVRCEEFYELIREFFTPEHAEIACNMPIEAISPEELAGRMQGMDATQLEMKLEEMADKGVVQVKERDDKKLYELLPFAPGFVEFEFLPGKMDDRSRRMYTLLRNYLKVSRSQSAASSPESPSPSGERKVVPVEKVVLSQLSVLPYDEVIKLIDSSEHIAAGVCGCRHGADLAGKSCDIPKNDMCMILGESAQFAASRGFVHTLSKDEARNIVDEAERIGLVHQYTNNKDRYIDYLCNCCGCHCAMLRGVMYSPSPGHTAIVNWMIEVDHDTCSGCGLCIDRCWMNALKMEGDVAVVDTNRCIGCGLCQYVCVTDALNLVSKETAKV